MDKKRVTVQLSCPICGGRNIVPVKAEERMGSFECLDCESVWTIVKPRVLGYEIKTLEDKKSRGRRRLANILDGVILGWLLSR